MQVCAKTRANSRHRPQHRYGERLLEGLIGGWVEEPATEGTLELGTCGLRGHEETRVSIRSQWNQRLLHAEDGGGLTLRNGTRLVDDGAKCRHVVLLSVDWRARDCRGSHDRKYPLRQAIRRPALPSYGSQ